MGAVVTPGDAPGGAAVFQLSLSEAPDALQRVLDLFAVQGARPHRVEMRRAEAGADLRIEVEDLAAERLPRLSGRLAASIFVRDVRQSGSPE